MAATPSLATPPPLREGGFRIVLAYRLCAILSYQIVAVTVGWHVYELTRDPFALGLIGLAEVLPYICMAPFAGYLVDHLPKRRLGAMACAGLCVTALLLALIASARVAPGKVWPIYAAIVLTGLVRTFLTPVYTALFAQVLRREQFARGAGVGSIFVQSAMVVGPALGGVLVGWAGKTAAYALAALLAVAAGLVLLSLRVAEPRPEGPRAPVFSSIGDGLRFVFGNQIMLGAQALDLFAVLFGGAISLAPAFIQEILHYGPEGLGILRGAPALGAVMVGLVLARRPPGRHAGRLLLYAVAGFGLCIIGFGLSRHFWLSALFLMLSGVCDGVSVVLRSTIMQLVTPDGMRGRVASINGIFIGSSNELGAFYAGSMARLLGLVPAVVLGGCVTLGVAATTAWKAPRLRRLDLKELQ
ncbi:MFS transporter [Pseudoxanthomonas broegbernensis]|uniref:MFS transporter n=1 Tax=Pseudoxanthomonas broegbernensis TaxID=83619 RepID=A0A7V8GPH7_9GAMM|nr:MFS transporter [Pseudoxanthomonas broegbernensis]KAF1687695.1 MFS transporter [Pseudoxanthomonas broegbernensis]MBB6064726.1 MFS family permease [Pseudoxanthomonas broegbernensis]